ncbi:MAG: hypothetical protein KJO31_02460 [Gammaproteobacteria bacterium]|nr:hypothetical protein [Gammaproteobacteria bacterium]
MTEQKPPKGANPHASRVRTDGRGRSVWDDTIKTANLELVSTQALELELKSGSEKCRRSIERAAEHTGEGILARDTATGLYEIIDDDDLREILGGQQDLSATGRPAEVTPEPAGDTTAAAGEELSLVSTQMLRKVLGQADLEEEDSSPAQLERSFNPYDSG